MQIVLLERVEKLGQMGDVVDVRNGYARNYLLPQGKALRASRENLQRFESERAEIEARNLSRKKEAEEVAEKLGEAIVTLLRQASDQGSLYGSVTSRDVVEGLSEIAALIERRQIRLDRPIKTLGMHDVRVELHPEVSSTVKVNVARSEEEAALQARGMTLSDIAAEAEREFEEELASEGDDELEDEERDDA